MATTKQDYFFKGKVAWLSKVGKRWPDKPNEEVFSVSFYPSDAVTRKALVATGIRNKMREDDGEKSGVEGFYYSLRSSGPFQLFTNTGEVFEGFVGNGSDVTLKLTVETFDSAQHGEVTRSVVDSVIIDNLIEFVPDTKKDPEPAKTEVPA